MSDNVEVDVEVSGWTPEQTALMLFNRVFTICVEERPRSVNGVLALYSKCLSVVKYSADPEMGERIANMAD
jgi:hypothetical protein